MVRLAFCTTLMLAAGLAWGGERYLVSARIFQGERLIGVPALTVAAGKLGSASTDGAYRLTVGVTPAADGALLVAAELAVGPDRMAPRMRIAPGQTGRAETLGVRLEVTVHQIDQRSG